MLTAFCLSIILTSFSVKAQIALSGTWVSTISPPNINAVGAGVNRMLIYVVCFEGNAAADVTSVTYGGQSLSQAVQWNTVVGVNQNRVEIWYLLEAQIVAAVGNTFTPTFNTTPPVQYFTSSATYTGVNQTTPICQSGSGSSTNSTTVTLSAGISMLSSELMIYATSVGDNPSQTPSSGFTQVDGILGPGHQYSSVNTRIMATNATINPLSIMSGSCNRLAIAALRIIPSGTTCFSPLPIELVDFKANMKGDKVALYWSTASEINNDFFTIERSVNAWDWEKVTTIEGAGNSSSLLYYSAIDHEPYSGISYYRLKQTDFDGQYAYSNIRSVNIDSDKDVVKLYPNPTNDRFYIVTSGDTDYNVSILNAYEKTVFNDMNSKEISTLDFSSGMYVVRIIFTDGETTIVKLIVNK